MSLVPNNPGKISSESSSERSFKYNNETYRVPTNNDSTKTMESTTALNHPLPDFIVLSLQDNLIAIHVMCYNSIEIISKKLQNQEIFYKITVFKIDYSLDDDEKSNNDAHIGVEFPTEIAIMNNSEHRFNQQNSYGRLYSKNEFVLFRSMIPVAENIGIRVDLYQKIVVVAVAATAAGGNVSTTPSQNAEVNGKMENFDKIAFCHIYPLEYKDTDGIASLPITSKFGKIIAKFKAEYFITKPFVGVDLLKSKTKTRSPKSWQLKKEGYDIGHRGLGVARRVDSQEKFLENTVDSFNHAFKKGADMVELDVQLSKDKVPIVYHDFNVNLVLQKREDQSHETFEMHIKDLTYNQLQKLKIKPAAGYDFEDIPNTPHSRPFASLKTVLESVESDCGFNVEIKYPQRKINGVWEAEKSHDLNEYVDLILKDLFLYAGERNIIISSFHPEICALARLKQDRYPVLFLTQGLTTKWLKYENPLNHSIEMATYLALCMNLYGIAVHAEDIIKDHNLINFVKSKSLVLFCWGDDLNNSDLIKKLKKSGIDGAIYDKIDLLVSKCKMQI